MLRDLVVAARRLRATPVFTLFAAASLALGMGATTAVYSAVYSLLWKPSGAQDADRIAVLVRSTPAGGRAESVTREDLDALQAVEACCERIAASARVAITVGDGRWSEGVSGEAVTGAYFQLLGVRAALGRVVFGADDTPSSPPVVVLSHRLWRTRLAADPAVVGRVLRLNGRPVEVVGVVDPAFAGFGPAVLAGTDAWVPVATWPAERRSRFTILGRLREGHLVGDAAREFAAAGRRLDAVSSGTEAAAGRQWSAASYSDALSGPARRGLPLGMIVMGLVGLVLAVASANLANLVLGRGASRRHELAVCRALGASRWRLVREQLGESLILGSLGAVGAYVVIRALLVVLAIDLQVTRTQIVRLDPELNLPALAVAAAALLLSLIVMGLVPAWRLSRQEARPLMTADPGGVSHRWWRGQKRSITWQVATSLGLLFVAATCIRVVVEVANHDSGVDIDRLAIGYLAKPRDWSPERTRQAFDRLVEIVRQQPGVEGAAVSSGLPFGTMPAHVSVTTVDRPFGVGVNDITATLVGATPDIFRVAGISILRGRGFDAGDQAPVVVVSAETARRLFGTLEVTGRDMRLRDWPVRADEQGPAGRLVRVTGVVSDTDTSRLLQRGNGAVYVPLWQHSESVFPYLTVIARTPGDPDELLPRLRTATVQADPDLAIGPGSGPGRLVLAGAYEGLRVLAILLGSLGMLAVVLSMAGLYGVLSHVTVRRTREIGLRMALGARHRDVLRLVLTDGLRPVLEGIIIAVVIATGARLTLNAVNPGIVGTTAFATTGLACLPLVLAAGVACYLPARRAAGIEPNEALREP
jgi:predicted permease